MIIEKTVDTAYLPLLKSISTTSSSYGTVPGEEFESAAVLTISDHTTSTIKQHTGGILHRIAARDEEEKDNIGGAGGRISPPSPVPPRHRASSSDGWSSGSLKKPPLVVRQTSSPTPHSVNKQVQQQLNETFSEHHVSLKLTTNQISRMSKKGGRHHRRTNSEDMIKCTTTNRHHRSGSRSSGKNNSFSGGTLDFESIMLIPDPRWGGGGLYKTFSNDSQQNNDDNIVTDMISHSTSTESGDYGYFGQQLELYQPYPLRRSMPSLLSKAKKHRPYSVSDVSTGSYDGSADPAVTDMTKSVLYKGITNRGVVKLQLPKDNFRLLIDRDLESGCVYKRDLVENENDYFQEYHNITIDTGVFEHRPIRPPLLPPMYYVMAVESDIYQRMLDEVSESRSSPCGLFYFGHHKDVSYPSIAIAAVSLTIVFSLMLWATFYVDG